MHLTRRSKCGIITLNENEQEKEEKKTKIEQFLARYIFIYPKRVAASY
jgi:hypothetical protein